MEVRGHLCDGLKKFQEYSTYSCIPSFTKEGYTEGCDATNMIPLKYCPFCGEKLPSVTLYKCKCTKCNNIWETYEKPNLFDYCNECYDSDFEIEEIIE